MKFFQKFRALFWSSSMFTVMLMGWYLISEYELVRPLFLPHLSEVVSSLWQLFTHSHYFNDIFISSYRVLGAFLLSAALAIPLGLWAGFSDKVSEVVEPFMGFARYLPVPALVPLCILWFGLNDSGKIVIIFLGTFFQLVLLVRDNAKGISQDLFEAGVTLGANQRQLFLKILWPAARPEVLNSCRNAMGWAWTYLVVAEIAGAEEGLGFQIMQAQRFTQVPKIFAGIIVIGILGVLFDQLFSITYNAVFPWVDSKS